VDRCSGDTCAGACVQSPNAATAAITEGNTANEFDELGRQPRGESIFASVARSAVVGRKSHKAIFPDELTRGESSYVLAAQPYGGHEQRVAQPYGRTCPQSES